MSGGVERDAYLLELSKYVVLNPVRAGMVADGSAWPWRSYSAMIALVPAPAWLQTDWMLGQFGSERHQAQAQYASSVAQGVGQASIWEGLCHQVFLGSDGFIERFSHGIRALDKLREVPRAQRRPLARALDHFQRTNPGRREAIPRAFLTGVYSMQKIADHFGMHYSTVSREVRWFEAIEQEDA